MFVEAHGPVPMPVNRARAALRVVLLEGLGRESVRAYDEGLRCLLKVGPIGDAFIGKRVIVSFLPERIIEQTLVVPLRWEATGPAGRLFPVLDANLGLTAAGAEGSLLSLLGCYTPPLGSFGRAIDEILLSKAANLTAQALVRETIERLRTASV